ncbi:hypothetical protein [Leifsonia sp. NPDC058248]|uniref:hypothetical protein n=1 Tax=Leifsonia sp. NPDC058248 TaxID=3346402 RepID=UPI0036DF43F1
MAARYAWVSVDARTGIVIADLPDLDVGSVSVALCQYQSTTATLPVPTAPENWLRATLPGAACLVLLRQQIDAFGNFVDIALPIWGGLITQRTRTEGDTVDLSLVTLEKYLDRRYVGTVTFTNTDQNTIIQTLVNTYVADGATPGIPIRVQKIGTGTVSTRTYMDADDKTVYSALTEIAGTDGGSEWTIGWEHLSSPERYRPVLFVSNRLGSPVTGDAPNATFDIPGPVTAVQFVENYGDDAGANDVMAVSTATGNVRPQSPHQNAGDPIRPTFEKRYTPSTSISDIATLTAHAVAALAMLANGSTSVSLSAAEVSAPAVGVDWVIGDDVGFEIGGLDANLMDLVPSFPHGVGGVGRAIGWTLNLGETAIIEPVITGVQIGA